MLVPSVKKALKLQHIYVEADSWESQKCGLHEQMWFAKYFHNIWDTKSGTSFSQKNGSLFPYRAYSLTDITICYLVFILNTVSQRHNKF